MFFRYHWLNMMVLLMLLLLMLKNINSCGSWVVAIINITIGTTIIIISITVIFIILRIPIS